MSPLPGVDPSGKKGAETVARKMRVVGDQTVNGSDARGVAISFAVTALAAIALAAPAPAAPAIA